MRAGPGNPDSADAIKVLATGEGPGLLQSVIPRTKLAGLLALVAAVVLSHRLDVIAALLVVGLVLVLVSQVRLMALLSGVWLAAVGLSCALALPALFLTPGPEVAELPLLGWIVISTGLPRPATWSCACRDGHVRVPAGFHDAVVARAQGAARLWRPGRHGRGARDDLPLHPAAARGGARHVRRASKPCGRAADRARTAAACRAARGRAGDGACNSAARCTWRCRRGDSEARCTCSTTSR